MEKEFQRYSLKSEMQSSDEKHQRRIIEKYNDDNSTELIEKGVRYVKLDVGGVYYTVSLNTLCKIKGSMLEAMFGGRFTIFSDKDGDNSSRVFIDRDGTLFAYILEFLRDGEVLVGPNDPLPEKIAREASYYGLEESFKLSNPSSSESELFVELAFTGFDFDVKGVYILFMHLRRR